MFAECSQAPFEPEIILFAILVLNEILILLVNGVVCQMHVLVVLVYLRGIGLGSESSQTFLKYVDSQWLITSHEHVDPKIKLVAVDQKWVGDISGDDRRIVNVDIINVIDNVDSLTLAGVCRLYYPHVLL